MTEHYPLYIDGKWIDTDECYEVRSPATEELVATVARGDIGHVDTAVAAAKAAFAEGTWRHTPPAERAALINTVAERLAARGDELAVLQSRENGATIRITGALHVGLSAAQLQYVAAIARDYLWETEGPAIEPVPAAGMVVREPIGVVAAIVPWNIPLLTTVWKIGPALAAGNSVVL
ncbi:MAG TPA: aldehyde dehydrogenase family protein, partial [Mycobacterium sp.]